MNSGTDIFKLIFEHDLRIEQLSGDYDELSDKKRPSTLEEFMKPVQTYSKFYLTGTRMAAADDYRFGLDALESGGKLFALFRDAVGFSEFSGGGPSQPVIGFLPERIFEPGQTYLLSPKSGLLTPERIEENRQLFSPDLAVREKHGLMRPWLDEGFRVLFTEKAHHGTDLHLFSKENIYEQFFANYRPLTGKPEFRFFSINGKRVRSERLFYFETWTLERPPHGFEEVHPETRLR